jgi:hypothetical protein
MANHPSGSSGWSFALTSDPDGAFTYSAGLLKNAIVADTSGGMFALWGSNLICGLATLAAGSYSVTVGETNADASNSPHDTVLSATVSHAAAETYVLLLTEGDSRDVGVFAREAVDDTDTTNIAQFVQEDPGTPGAVLGGYPGLALGLSSSLNPVQQAIGYNGTKYLSPIEYAARKIRDAAGFRVDIAGGGWNGAKVAGTGHILGPLPDSVTANQVTKGGRLRAARAAASPSATLRPLILKLDTTNDGGTDPAVLLAAQFQALADLRTATGFGSAPIVVISTTPEHREDHGAAAVANMVEQANMFAALKTANAFYCNLPRGYGDLHEGETPTPNIQHVRDAGYISYGRTCLIALGQLAGTAPTITVTDKVNVVEGSADEITLAADVPIYFTVAPGSTSLVTLSGDTEILGQVVRPTGGAWPAYDAGTPANNTRSYTLNYKTADGITGSITRHVVVQQYVAPAGISFLANTVAHFTSGSSGCTTSGINTTGADFLLASVTGYSGGLPGATITDSKGNTWTALTEYDGSDGNVGTRNFYCVAPTVGAGHTFTLSGANVYGRLNVTAWNGVDQTMPIDSQRAVRVSGGSGPGSSGSLTPVHDGSLLVSLFGMGAGTSPADASSPAFTVLDAHNGIGVQDYSTGLSYYIQSTAARISASWTWAIAGGNHVIGLLAVKPA